MNYSILNRQELLRLAEPETDLEIKLIELLDEDFNDLHYAKQKVEEMENAAAGLESENESLDITIGKLEDYNDELQELLDKHNIDYSGIST